MKWFKHYSDMHRGRSMDALFEAFGHMGPCSYYILVEMCSEKLEKPDSESLTEVDCSFGFSQRILRQNLRISQTNLRRVLDGCQTNGLLEFEFSGNEVKIKMPILLDLLDRRTKKASVRRQQSVRNVSLDIDKDKEEDVEKIKNPRVRKKAAQPEAVASPIEPEILSPGSTKVFIASYCEAYKARYKTNPIISKTISGIAKRIAETLKDDGPLYASVYLTMNDSWFLTRSHDLATMESNLSRIKIKVDTGRMITRSDIKQIETQDHYTSQMERMGLADGA